MNPVGSSTFWAKGKGTSLYFSAHFSRHGQAEDIGGPEVEVGGRNLLNLTVRVMAHLGIVMESMMRHSQHLHRDSDQD